MRWIMWRGWRRWVAVLGVGACVVAWLFFGRSRGAERARTASGSSQPKTADGAPTPNDPRGSSAKAKRDPLNGAGKVADAGPAGAVPLPIDEIRAVLIDDPVLAEQLARADQERFPDRPDADERDALLVAAVYNQHQPTRARKEARVYFRKHPDGRFKDFLQKGTRASVPPPVASSP
jgi:hypothetical protein